jgi:hypothetical protein
MKREKVFVGLLAVVLVLGFVLAGCTLPNSGTGDDPPTVTGVTVSPATVIVKKTGTEPFTATVAGTNNPLQAVKWLIVTADTAADTKFASNVLTIAADEGNTTITVKAISIADTSMNGTATVKVAAEWINPNDITVANDFLADAAITEVLALTTDDLGTLDAAGLDSAETAVQEAWDAFNTLDSGIKALLSEENAKLAALAEGIAVLQDGGSLTENTPSATIDYAAEKLTGLANGSYSINDGDNVNVTDGTYSITSLISTSEDISLSIVKKGNGLTITDSTAQTNLILPPRPAAPSAAGGAGKITNTTALMEYKTASGGSWADCSATETAVANGDYVVRLKATDSAFAGVETGTLTVTDLGLYIGTDTSPQANTDTLALALGWLQTNTANNTDYTILLGADESLPPWTLGSSELNAAARDKTGVTITLKGKDAERTVQLSGTDSLFTVGGGVTLILDENITLKGISDNTKSLVSVWSALEMRENAKITGNTITASFSFGGGVNVWSGTFTMNGNAAVSGNSVSGSSITMGGGVYISGGTFAMNDSATVTGNTVSATASSSGGGVSVSAGGTFTMNDSASVSGNTATGTGSSAGGVYMYAASSGGGVSASGTFTMNDSATVSGNTASAGATTGGGVAVSSGTFTMNDSASVSNNTASATAPYSVSPYSYGGGVYVYDGTFTMNGGTVYGSSAGTNANKLQGSGTNYGVSLYKGSDATAEYGDGSPIITGNQTTALYTGVTLTDSETRTYGINTVFVDGGSGAFSQETFTLYKAGLAEKTISLIGSWDGQTWYVGAQAVGTGPSITLDAANYSVGPHTLSVTVRKVTGGTVAYWSKELTFTVAN